MSCPACMLALFADAPRFASLIHEARASPHGKVCVCADCRSIMGADSARPLMSKRSPLPIFDFLGGDTSDALAGAGSSSESAEGAATSSGGDVGSGSSKTGIDLSSLAALAGSVDPAKIAAFVAALAGRGGASGVPSPPPAPPAAPVKKADDSQIWTVALIVLLLLTFYVLSTNKKR